MMNVMTLRSIFRTKRPNVFIIEDNSMFRLNLEMIINRRYEMNTYDFDSYEACMSKAEEKPHLIILDHGLPGLSGLDAIKPLKEKWPQAQIIVISSLRDTSAVLKFFKAGICDFIEKTDYSAEELFKSINKALAQLHMKVPLKKKSKGHHVYHFGVN